MTKHVRLIVVAMVSALLLVLAGCSADQITPTSTNKATEATATKESNTTTKQSQDSMSKMTIYVPLDNGKGVTPKLFTVDSDKKTMAYAITFLLDEDSRQSYPIFPKGTKVNGVNLKNHTAIIDLSKEFLDKSNVDGLTAQLRLAALVNTATEFDGVTSVQFLVDGKTIDVYGGYDVSEPLERMEKQIVK
ncbi:GerMN domain-containing protein [uncultured Veillonella sp.]|uniref:GerMN domain-containing protein n=1 Tax=uncultured Veillonella sp. TaxID=159268 RepID=UPI0026267FC9|nr:GerMN domain-containing protein [uncultured Veillonella sp.]